MSTNPDKDFRVEQAAASDDSIQQVHARLQKQKPEKTGGGYPLLPLGILGLTCTAIFLGSLYLAHYSIRFDPLVTNEQAKRDKPSTGKAVALTRAQLGKRVFSTTCITCHQANGLGIPGQYPPLAGSEWAQGDEQRVIRIVLHGLNGPITVQNKEFNNVMAPLGEALNDEQIADAISYVRSEWGNKAPEVETDTVAKVRADTAGRKTYWTAAELQKIGK